MRLPLRNNNKLGCTCGQDNLGVVTGVPSELNGLWDTITTNVSQGWDNLVTAASGHPIDALTQSAIDKATNDAVNKNGAPLTQAQKDAVAKTVTVQAVQEKTVTDVKDAAATSFDFLGGIATKFVIAAVATIVLIKVGEAFVEK